MVRIRSVLAFSAVFFTLQNAFSVTHVDSEFELMLPKTFQKSLLDEQWKKLEQNNYPFHWNFSDQQVNADNVQVNLSGISLDLKTELARPSLPASSTAVILKSKALQADLSIKAIDVDQIVEKEIDGVLGRFHVKAHCANVQLQMAQGQGQVSIQLSPVLNENVLQTHVDDVELSWTPQAWTVLPFTCTGVEGFESLVKQYVTNIASNSAPFVAAQKAGIISSLQATLQSDSINLAQPRTLISGRSDITAALSELSFVTERGNGTLLHGQLTVNFANSDRRQGDATLALSATGALPLNSDSATIRLPESFVNEVVRRAFAANSWKQRVAGSQIPGFTSLRSSVFEEFFIWPELLQYPKSANFLFDVTSSQDVIVKGSNLNYQVSSTFKAQMYAPRDNTYVPFMNFTLPLQSQVQMSVVSGVVQANFVSNTLDLTANWDQSYLDRYNPAQHFSTSTVKSAVTKAMTGTSLKYTLPEIPLTSDVNLTVQKVQKIPQSTDLEILLQ